MDGAGRSAPRHSFFLGGASPDHVCDTMGRPRPPDHIRARMDMIRSIYIHADVNIYIYVVRRAKNRNMDWAGAPRHSFFQGGLADHMCGHSGAARNPRSYPSMARYDHIYI